MITFKRTDAENSDFQKLVSALDADLSNRDGEEHAFYSQFNKLNLLRFAIVAYEGSTPVACGAIKHFSGDTVEIKRMYVPPELRGKGIASKLLAELEEWAKSLQYKRCILETGKRQPEAIRLYEKNGYSSIPNYGQYQSVENSLCFERTI